MKALVDAGARQHRSRRMAPPWHLPRPAAEIDAVKYSLEFDPDLTAIGPEGKSIMHFAIANKNPDLAIPVIQYLTDKGAKLDVPNAKGDTPGDFINRGGQQDIRLFYIQLLRDHGIVSHHDH
jgi:ankyrin repeat protein